MKSMIILFFVAFLAYSQASVIGLGLGATIVGPSNPGALLRGPASHAAVAGPDGSLITGVAQAGSLAAAPIAGGVVSAAVSPGVVGLGLGHGDLWGR